MQTLNLAHSEAKKLPPMDALDAHTTMSTQALGSERARDGLKDTPLGLAQLYEALRARSAAGDARA